MNATNDIFQGLSILMLSEDDARGKALAKALRDHKARVGETKIATQEGGRGVDLVVVDTRAELASAPQLAALRADVRGRWASVVTIDYEKLVRADGSVLLGSLAERVAPLVEADRRLTERAREETSFSTSLAPLGPPRTLRALSLSGHTLFVELHAKTLDAVLEVSNELLVSASATRADKRWEAWSALVRILGLGECEVTVKRRAFTSLMNIMEPVDQALEVAAQERQCAAEQIAAEEAGAEAHSTAAHKSPARPTAGAAGKPAKQPPPPPPPARPALGHQRTLMGVIPGLPTPGIAANDVRPKGSVRPPEAPRYAHRPGQATGSRAMMTLMGVAPSAIPGLAELRAPRAAPAAEDEPDPRAAQRQALKHALAEVPEFDPPTARRGLDSLPDLTDDLPDLMDEFSFAAQPLSSPLPPPMSERDDVEHEPVTQPSGLLLREREDEEDRTTVTPSHLTEALLAQVLGESITERPPAPGSDPGAIALDVSLARGPARFDQEPALQTQKPALESQQPASQTHKPALEVVQDRTALEEPTAEEPTHESEPPGAPDADGPIEETLVVKVSSTRPKSRVGMIGALALLVALLALVFYAATRAGTAASGGAATAAEVTPPVARPSVAAAASTPSAKSANTEREAVAAKAPSDGPEAELARTASTEPQAASAPLAAAPAIPPTAAPVPQEADSDALPTPVADAHPAPAAEAQAEPADETAPSGVDPASELLRKAQRLLAQRALSAARPLFEQAVALQADNPHARAGLAETLLKLRELPLALMQAEAAVKLRPKRGRYHVLYGDVLQALGRVDQARTAFLKALTLDPSDADAKRKLEQ